MIEKYQGNLAEESIDSSVLAIIDKNFSEQRFIMPIKFEDGTLTIVTSKYYDNILDCNIILNVIQKKYPQVKEIKLLEISYEMFRTGYTAHYKTQFQPSITTNLAVNNVSSNTVTTEQTKLSENIIAEAINLGASDIHITPVRDGSTVIYRVDGKLITTEFSLNLEDEAMINNIYKRKAELEVNNLIPQDGRFTFMGKNIRLSTMPFGGDGSRNKIVLRVLSTSDVVPKIEDLGFNESECKQLRDIMYKPSGIILVCGPTGEGKTTTQYAMLNELNESNDYIIVTFEDPIERYINGIAQSQVRDAEDERTRYTFLKGLRSALRQDPNIILIGETRDAETAQTAVQASQTGHLIFSTLHVRNSISVFRRLNDMGANVSGFAEQIVGIASQRLLALNCPHCRKAIVSELNSKLRNIDLQKLENGSITYEATGCTECNGTGIAGRIPVIEIITFNNFLRDYFAEKHGLIDIEKTLRKKINFKSLWDKGFALVQSGDVSLKELLSKIESDEDIEVDITNERKEKDGYYRNKRH